MSGDISFGGMWYQNIIYNKYQYRSFHSEAEENHGEIFHKFEGIIKKKHVILLRLLRTDKVKEHNLHNFKINCREMDLIELFKRSFPRSERSDLPHFPIIIDIIQQ